MIVQTICVGIPKHMACVVVCNWSVFSLLPGALYIGIVNPHLILPLGAMLVASSAPACLLVIHPAHASHEQGTRLFAGFINQIFDSVLCI